MKSFRLFLLYFETMFVSALFMSQDEFIAGAYSSEFRFSWLKTFTHVALALNLNFGFECLFI